MLWHFCEGNIFVKNMYKVIAFIVSFISLPMGLAGMASAASADRFGLGYGQNAGLGTRDVRDTTVAIIRTALGILGVLFLLLVIWSVVGVAAGGGDEAGEKARKTLSAAVIGLIVVFVAFALTTWVFNILERTT